MRESQAGTFSFQKPAWLCCPESLSAFMRNRVASTGRVQVLKPGLEAGSHCKPPVPITHRFYWFTSFSQVGLQERLNRQGLPLLPLLTTFFCGPCSAAAFSMAIASIVTGAGNFCEHHFYNGHSTCNISPWRGQQTTPRKRIKGVYER